MGRPDHPRRDPDHALYDLSELAEADADPRPGYPRLYGGQVGEKAVRRSGKSDRPRG